MIVMTKIRFYSVTIITAALMLACSTTTPSPSSGPAIPSGVTLIPGGPMEPTPPVSSPKIPSSQQQAQDTVLDYLQKTVNGLPPGTVLDSSDTIGGSNLSCDDDYMGNGPGPTEYSVRAHVIAPVGITPAELIALTADVWRSWGITVVERNGFEKPNRFAYPLDGYGLQIESAYPATYSPTLTVISPCFAGDLRQDGLPFPKVIRQNSPTT